MPNKAGKQPPKRTPKKLAQIEAIGKNKGDMPGGDMPGGITGKPELLNAALDAELVAPV